MKPVRLIKPSTLTADAVQFGTEVVGHLVGLVNPRLRKQANRALGGMTAMGIGALGGPVGIAVAAGTLMLGEIGGEATVRALAHQQSLRDLDRTTVKVVVDPA